MNDPHIVLATDFSREAEIALEQALQLARRSGGRVTLVHAAPLDRATMLTSLHSIGLEDTSARLSDAVASARAKLDDLHKRYADEGVDLSRELVSAPAYHGVSAFVEESRADLVVVGTHGRTGIKRLLLGSQAERLVRLSKAPVLVAREPVPTDGFRRILVGTDFSNFSERALVTALALAGKGAEIDLLHCVRVPSEISAYFAEGLEAVINLEDRLVESAGRKGQELVERFGGPRVHLRFNVVRAGAAHGIEDALAAKPYELAAVGSHGQTGVLGFVIGSVAAAVVRRAPCSVLVYRNADSEHEG